MIGFVYVVNATLRETTRTADTKVTRFPSLAQLAGRLVKPKI